MTGSSTTSSEGLQFTHPYLAVVLGGGFTGMLAAATLSEHADVIVVERERLPRTPALPTDLPQARHVHLLTADGARLVDALLPGSVDRWLAEGARRVPQPAELTGRPSKGWSGRRAHTECLIACSRDLLDRVIRRQVPALPGVSVLDGTEAAELTGTAEHITGVRVRDTTTGATYRLDADLVVDATGRHSTTQDRLAARGLPTAHEEVSDSGIVSATRIFRAPVGMEVPVLTTRSACTGPVPGPLASRRPVPGKTATLVPIEDGRWLVTLTGTGDDRPSEHAGRFVPFARRTGNGVIGDLITDAEPLSEVRLSRDTTSRRRRYEQLPSWPTGFVVLGGAVASLAPDCGQSLSLAAHGAAALRGALRRHGMDDPALARKVQQTIGRLVQEPWSLAAGTGLHSPTAGRPVVSRAYLDVVTPSAPKAPARRLSAALGLLRGTSRIRPAASGTPGGPAAPEAAPAPVPATTGTSSAAGPRTPAATGAAALPATPAATLSAAPPVPGQPAAPPPHPGSEPAPRRLPRPLGFGPTALRRIGGAGRRKPADG
ncbi:NAD(P)/FAD-dependent oxidoreductase [Streptomyces decoyicus]|uniref:NAD(P)/FAD-dependent oxidoreductase n=1 Tax=Streptomyces decoyicus TaxID=249567 RepID=UPI0033B50F89